MTTIATMDHPAGAIDLAAIKRNQQAMWGSGDYSVLGTTIQIVAENLCEAADVQAGERVLDVCTGTGNTAIAAARRGCEVEAIDYAPTLLDRGRTRAAAEGLAIRFREGDVESLPVPDGAFDVVLSSCGCMFAPDQDRAAGELLRVCRTRGRIAMANWTPDGLIGQMFRTVGKYVPPPAGLPSPARWGTEAWLEAAFGAGITALVATRRHYIFRYRSAEEWLDTFRRWYGPVLKAFAALPADRQRALAGDLVAVGERCNTRTHGFAAPAEYLEVVLTRK